MVKTIFSPVLVLVLYLTAVAWKSGPPSQTQGIGNSQAESWQKSLDLDFERPGLDGWSMGGEWYKIETDNTEFTSGTHSLRFTLVKERVNRSFGFAALQLPVAVFRGKRIRFSGALKTRDATPSFSLWARADAGEDPAAVKHFPRSGIENNTDWKRFTLEMDIPAEATALYAGAAMTGTGTAWIDELTIAVLPPQGAQDIIIAGKVTDKNRIPVKDALIGITVPLLPLDKLVQSDAAGEFQFRVPSGTYALAATAPGLTAVSLPARGFQQDTRDLVLTLGGDPAESFIIQGKIVLPAGHDKLPPGTNIKASSPDAFFTSPFCVYPQGDGSFALAVPKAEYYIVDVECPGYKALPVTTAAESNQPCIFKVAALQPAPEEVVTWMKQQAVPLATAEAGHGFADLEPLKEIIGDARIVALGEASHGSREIFQMKHRFLEFLVEEMGFTVFAIEGNGPEAVAVNNYVLTGDGNPETLLADMNFWTWDTEEVLEMIRWIRKYNADPAHKAKVKFYGVDMQFSQVATQYIAAYLEKTEPALLKQHEKALTVLRDPFSFFVFFSLTPQERAGVTESISWLMDHLERRKSAYIAGTSRQEWELARRQARALGQFVELVNASVPGNAAADGINVRDRIMADNTKEILDREPPGTRIMLWAHNGHIQMDEIPSDKSIPIGVLLRRSFGRQYMTIGFVFNQGGFQARDFTSDTLEKNNKGFTVGPAPAGTFEEAMARAGIPIFFLDLRRIPAEGVVQQWFSVPHLYKNLGAIFTTEKDIMDFSILPRCFDAVIFIEKTTRARPNPTGRRPRYPFPGPAGSLLRR